MGETLTEQRRVSDEGLRIVKLCYEGRTIASMEWERSDGTSPESDG